MSESLISTHLNDEPKASQMREAALLCSIDGIKLLWYHGSADLYQVRVL